LGQIQDIDTFSLVHFLTQAVQKAGNYAKQAFQKRLVGAFDNFQSSNVRQKFFKELVIEEDLICEKIIIDFIRKEDKSAAIYSEELNNIDLLADDQRDVKFIIDPLDGTHNFCFGLPYWGISCAVLDRNNTSIGGAIFIPMLNIFLRCVGSAAPSQVRSGRGWRLVRTSHKKIEESLVCYDNQFYKLDKEAFAVFESITASCFTTRITGSACCDMALIATGKINARVWNDANSYDVAAGMLIVGNAGGEVVDFDGMPANIFSKQLVASSNRSLSAQLIHVLRSHRHNPVS